MTEHSRIQARIDLDALEYNMNTISELAGDRMLMPVIKTNAYGHGSVTLGRELEKNPRVRGFAVATAEEAAELITAGIKKPVMLLGGAFPDVYDMILKYNIRACVFTWEQAEGLNRRAEECDVDVKVHIAVDTGMNRIGFEPVRESALTVRKISELPRVTVEGVFTHFARADENDKTRAYEQLSRINAFVDMLEEEGVRPEIVHAANSASILDFKDSHFDMVRPGIILYGLMPSDDMAEMMKEKGLCLKPLMSLISHVVYVKEVHPGEEISYGGTYSPGTKRLIATIPAGYGDGYPRVLSNKGSVLIKGKRAPITGRVCMDQFMVDVTDIEGVRAGDEVVLIGEQGGDRITMEEMGDLSGRFNYELACDINRRVPRVYTKNGAVAGVVDYLCGK